MTQVRATKAAAPSPQSPRPIRVACRPTPGGRLAIVLKVMPVHDAAAERGVFVDFVMATADPAARRAERLTRTKTPGRRAITSHRIAPARKLVGGEPETFRTELELPTQSVTGSAWFVRGRIATAGGDELRSSWVQVT